MLNWSGKTVIITGSSMGIGKAMAQLAGSWGATVILNARRGNKLRETQVALEKDGGTFLSFPADVSDPEACHQLIQYAIAHTGRLDVLINNAGISMKGTLYQTAPSVWRKLMEVNILGSVYPTQAAIPYLRQTKGSVLFIGSVAGIHGIGGFSPYASSKMALTAIAESLEMEESPHQVHVGIAYVGFTENDPDKMIYSTDGQLVEQPKNSVIKPMPVEEVAHKLLMMVEHRQFKQVLSFLGKINSILNRIAPGLVQFILKRNYLRGVQSDDI